MTVKEVIEKLSEHTGDIQVFVPSRTCNYQYGTTYSVYELKIIIRNNVIGNENNNN